MNHPIGYQTFHRQRFINYQLNRLHAEGYARPEDLRAAAAAIRSLDDYGRAFVALADAAEREGRLKNAAFYVRAAEFFAAPASGEKGALYRRFRDLFYRAFADAGIVQHQVAYGAGSLPAAYLPAVHRPARGDVLIFGGFDSLIEEFFVIWRGLAEAGYNVIAFEGPGQGGARALYGLRHTHDWERPVAAILDHFQLSRAALVGISMGGYWALRAAAFEPRITHVVSWSPVYDWMAQIPPLAQRFMHWLMGYRSFMNTTIRWRTRLIPVLAHAVRQANYMVDGHEPMDAVDWLLGMNRHHLHSERVRQHVLLMGGEEDTFQPVKLLRQQQAALTAAASVTARIFTPAEHAAMHCQMGNLPLAIQTLVDWLEAAGFALFQSTHLHESSRVEL